MIARLNGPFSIGHEKGRNLESGLETCAFDYTKTGRPEGLNVDQEIDSNP
jgi:hypothetical protein